MHVTQHDTWMMKSVCIKLQLYYNIIHHFIFVFFLYFFYHSSCRKDQFTVLSLKFGSIVLDYEQSLFFLSPSSKTRETLKWPSSWLKVRDWRSRAAALVFPVSRLRRSRERAPCSRNLKKKSDCSRTTIVWKSVRINQRIICLKPVHSKV